MSTSPFAEPTGFPAPPVTTTKPRNTFFFGRFGLRAGWGIAIFLIVAAILIFLSGFAALAASGQFKAAVAAHEFVKAHPGQKSPFSIQFTATFLTANDGIGFLTIFAFCWLLSRAERRPLHYYGIGKSRRRDFIPGAIWGIFIMSALTFFLRSQHLLVFDGRALHGASVLYYGAFWLLGFIFVGFAEEYELRGYLQYTFTRAFWGIAERISPDNPYPVAFWIAATVTSVAFGALHLGNKGENALGILQVVFVGLVFCYALYRTGSLWWGIGFHALWDWSQSFLFGVPDSGNISVGRLFVTHPAGNKLLSGGTDGPEGSIFSAIAVFLTIFAIYFTTKPGIHPPPDQLPQHEDNLPPETSAIIA